VIFGPIIAFFYLGFLAFWAWVIWKFYEALSRIGDELGYIRSVLQQRLPPAAPEPATRRPDLNET
jgi:hypothetical protein